MVDGQSFTREDVEKAADIILKSGYVVAPDRGGHEC